MAVLNLVNGFAADAIGVSNVLWILGLGFTVIVLASLGIGTLRNIYRGVSAVPAAAG